MVNKILGGLFGKVLDNAEGILDEIITTDEEREKVKLEIKKIAVSKPSRKIAKNTTKNMPHEDISMALSA